VPLSWTATLVCSAAVTSAQSQIAGLPAQSPMRVTSLTVLRVIIAHVLAAKALLQENARLTLSLLVKPTI